MHAGASHPAKSLFRHLSGRNQSLLLWLLGLCLLGLSSGTTTLFPRLFALVPGSGCR